MEISEILVFVTPVQNFAEQFVAKRFAQKGMRLFGARVSQGIAYGCGEVDSVFITIGKICTGCSKNIIVR